MSDYSSLASKVSSQAFAAEAFTNSLLSSSVILEASSGRVFSSEELHQLDAHVADLLSNLDKLEADLVIKQAQESRSFQQHKVNFSSQMDKSAKQIGEFKAHVITIESLIGDLSSLSQAGSEAVHILRKAKNLQKSVFLLQLFNEFIVARLLGGVSLHFEFAPVAKGGTVVIDQLEYEHFLAAGSLYKTIGGADPEMLLTNTYYSKDHYFIGTNPSLHKPGSLPPGKFEYTPYTQPKLIPKEGSLEHLLFKQNRVISSPYEDSPYIPPAFRYLLNNPFTRHQMLFMLKEMIAAFDMHSLLSVPRFDCLENVSFSWSLLSVPELRSQLPTPLSSEQLNAATVETVAFIKRLYDSITSLHSMIPYPPTSSMSQRLNELVEAANTLISYGPEQIADNVYTICTKYAIHLDAHTAEESGDSQQPAQLHSAKYSFDLYRHRYGLLYELCCALDYRKRPDFAKARRIIVTMDVLGVHCYDLVYEAIAYACIKATSHLLTRFADSLLLQNPEDVPDILSQLSFSRESSSVPDPSPEDPQDDPVGLSPAASKVSNPFLNLVVTARTVFPPLTEYFTASFCILKGMFRICFLTLSNPHPMIIQVAQLVLRIMVDNITAALDTVAKEYVNDKARISLILVRVYVIIKCLMEDLVRKITALNITELLRGVDLSGLSFEEYPLVYGYDFRFSSLDEAKMTFTDSIVQKIRSNIDLLKETEKASSNSVGSINPQIIASIFAPFEQKTGTASLVSSQVSRSAALSDFSYHTIPDINIVQIMMYPISDIQTTNLYSWSYYFEADEEFDNIPWAFDEYFVNHYLNFNTKVPLLSELTSEIERRKTLYEQTQALYIMLCEICKNALAKTANTVLLDGESTGAQTIVLDLDAIAGPSIDLPSSLARLSSLLTGLNKFKASAFVEDIPGSYYQPINKADFKFLRSLNNSLAMQLVPQLPAFMSIEVFINKPFKAGHSGSRDDISLLELLTIYEKIQSYLPGALTSSSNRELSLLVHQFLPAYYRSSALRVVPTYAQVTASWPFIDRTLGEVQMYDDVCLKVTAGPVTRANKEGVQSKDAFDSIIAKLSINFLETAEHAIKLLFQHYFIHESIYLENYLSATVMLEPFRSHHEATDTLIMNTCSKGLSSSLFSEQSLNDLITKYKAVIYRARYMFFRDLSSPETAPSRPSFYSYKTQTFQTVQATLIKRILAFLVAKIGFCITGYASLCFSASAGYFPEGAVQDSSSMEIHDVRTATYRILPLLITSPPGTYAIEPISKSSKLKAAWKEYGESILALYTGDTVSTSAFSLSLCRVSDCGTPFCFGNSSIEYTKKNSGYSISDVKPILLAEKRLGEEHPGDVTMSRSFASATSGVFIPLTDHFFDIISATLTGLQEINDFLITDVLAFEQNEEMDQIIHRELKRFYASAELALHRLSNLYVELTLAGCRIIYCNCKSNSYSEADIMHDPDTTSSKFASMSYEEFCQWASSNGSCMVNSAERIPLHVRYIFELLTNQLSVLVSTYEFRPPSSRFFSSAAPLCKNLLPPQSASAIACKILAAFPTLYLAHLSRFYFKGNDPLLVIAELKVLSELYHTIQIAGVDYVQGTLQEIQQSKDKLDLIKAVLLTSSSTLSQEVAVMIRRLYLHNRGEILLLLQILARRLTSGLGFITTGEPTRRGDRFRESSFGQEFDVLCKVLYEDRW
ncbi:Hypothetical protein GLP15_471 [Giardia lamblia P15]|uniref:Uncharacterized protein n=1 Tax=Giardia intestinalis (strain P15) TaxID=658858 RepID=E1F6H7_GIAIA|nr:Hypothetical protein GLP15_471 [Giardia lamblia P15]